MQISVLSVWSNGDRSSLHCARIEDFALAPGIYEIITREEYDRLRTAENVAEDIADLKRSEQDG